MFGVSFATFEQQSHTTSQIHYQWGGLGVTLYLPAGGSRRAGKEKHKIKKNKKQKTTPASHLQTLVVAKNFYILKGTLSSGMA